MPLVDMPLEKLRQYQGSSPCPADIDVFWDRAIAEMKSVDAKIELAPANFQSPSADCFDLYFTGVGGARIHCKYYRPKNALPKNPAIVIFHGYSCNSGNWVDHLHLAASGFCVAVMDCRGQGGSSEDAGSVKGTTLRGHIIRGLDDSPEKLLFRQVFLDTAQLAGIVMSMPEVDASRVASQGGSQGGALSLVCAALEPGINRVASTFPFLSDYKRTWNMDLYKGAYEELNYFFRSFDPRHEREDEIFMRLGYIDIQNIAKRIRGRVLMACGLMDTICPPSTQFAAYNKIIAPKDIVIYPDFAHEGLPGWNDMTYKFMVEMQG